MVLGGCGQSHPRLALSRWNCVKFMRKGLNFCENRVQPVSTWLLSLNFEPPLPWALWFRHFQPIFALSQTLASPKRHFYDRRKRDPKFCHVICSKCPRPSYLGHLKSYDALVLISGKLLKSYRGLVHIKGFRSFIFPRIRFYLEKKHLLKRSQRTNLAYLS